ncbi:efflux RND transporter periplasmic adaptor subunit [Wandonia haliotis]|uniref:Efflux RND transporter periplasmic adaptor subunit n=1 Tax=Wandonia haliotis TaxID=574963 RepID=A0ABP3Y7K6_9FLAO
MKISYLFPLVLLLVACSQSSPETQEQQKEALHLVTLSEEQLQTNDLKIGPIATHFFNREIQTNGTVDVPPANRFKISAYFKGYVKEIRVIEGDAVTKGQLLARIEHPDLLELQKQYAATISRFTYIEKEYNRIQLLEQNDAIAKKELNRIQSEFETLKAERNNLEQQLVLIHLPISKIAEGNFFSSYGIYAPTSGQITQVNVSSGELVGDEKPILEMINTDKIRVELEVFEKDIAHLKEQQPVRFSVQGDETIHTGVIFRIGSEIKTDRRVTVTVDITDSKSLVLKTGAYVSANIILDQKQLPALPGSAIVKKGEQYFALLLTREEDQYYYFKQVKVPVTLTNGNWYGIDPEQIDTSAQFLLNGAFDLVY